MNVKIKFKKSFYYSLYTCHWKWTQTLSNDFLYFLCINLFLNWTVVAQLFHLSMQLTSLLWKCRVMNSSVENKHTFKPLGFNIALYGKPPNRLNINDTFSLAIYFNIFCSSPSFHSEVLNLFDWFQFCFLRYTDGVFWRLEKDWPRGNRAREEDRQTKRKNY